MKNLELERVTILSLKEKKAKIIELKSGINVIQGDNKTGKSSFLKSIYYAFGAETGMHPTWIALNPIVIVDFRYNSQKYTIMRNVRNIWVYDADKNLIHNSSSITRGFTPFFSRFFNFKVELTTRNRVKQQATPAFCLMPFYIDQDLSWEKNWNSFQNLGQFTNWRKDLAAFHSGVTSSNYYSLKSQKDTLLLNKNQLEIELQAIEGIRNQSLEEIKDVDFTIPLDEFKHEITNLLEELNKIKSDSSQLKEKLRELYKEKEIIKEQIKITNHSLRELNKDYEYCVKDLGHNVDCPTCGAIYENSFAERFSIANDEDQCLDLKMELESKYSQLLSSIEKSREKFFETHKRMKLVDNLLQTKKKRITLRELISYEGSRSLISRLSTKIQELRLKIQKISRAIIEINKQLKKIIDPRRKKRIIETYRQNMGQFLKDLNVKDLPFESYKELHSSIHEKGSDKPRALLAYYFSILKVMSVSSDSGTFFPIIIDAPLQQEQDQENTKVILDFIGKNCPEDTQLILGIISLEEINFEGNTVLLSQPHSFLGEEDYSQSQEYFKELQKNSQPKSI